MYDIWLSLQIWDLIEQTLHWVVGGRTRYHVYTTLSHSIWAWIRAWKTTHRDRQMWEFVRLCVGIFLPLEPRCSLSKGRVGGVIRPMELGGNTLIRVAKKLALCFWGPICAINRLRSAKIISEQKINPRQNLGKGYHWHNLTAKNFIL